MIAAGVLGGVGLLGSYFVDATHDVDGLTRIEIGGQGTVEVDEPGELAVYHEYDGASSDHLDRPLPDVTVVDPSGAPVRVVDFERGRGRTVADVAEASAQGPIGSGFGAATTAAEVIAAVDLSGRTAIVTGGYSGLGVETARALRNAGASVVVPTRDRAKAEETLAGIDGVELQPMDLMDPPSIVAFARDFVASGRPLHILVNSAGIMAVPLARTAQGYESQFATNHLGHFHLVVGLWPALLRGGEAGGARVVSVSSWGHRYSDIIWDDLHYDDRRYDPLAAYGQSKTGNNLLAVEVDRRGHEHGIRAFSLHPGSIVTPLARHAPVELLQALGVVDDDGEPIIDPSRNMKNPQQGAATSVWCAVSPQLDGMGGVYCENCDVSPLITDVDIDRSADFSNAVGSTAMGVLAYSVDPEAAARLWAVSAELTGVSL